MELHMPLVAIVYGDDDYDHGFIGRHISEWVEVTDSQYSQLRNHMHMIPYLEGFRPRIIIKPADMKDAVHTALDSIQAYLDKQAREREQRKQEEAKRIALAQERNKEKRRERDRKALEALVAKNPQMVKDLINKSSI
jgi:hypothetical protein